MPVFMCRWANGDISFAAASSRLKAAMMLDELAAVDPKYLRTVPEFMVHFRLTDRGALELRNTHYSAISPGFGEHCSNQIDAQYPAIQTLLDSELPKPGEDKAFDAAVREAVAKERERVVWKEDRLEPQIGQLVQETIGTREADRHSEALRPRSLRRRRGQWRKK
jgi:hypothetical protein